MKILRDSKGRFAKGFGERFSDKHKENISKAKKGKLPKNFDLFLKKAHESSKGRVPWNKGKKMSQRTIEKIRLSKTGIKQSEETIAKRIKKGKEHWNWKGGITPLNKLLRCSAKWQIWRNLIFLRDNFTCQNPNCDFCNNKIGVKLHPHHIKPFALYPELAFRVENGITYCAEFHIRGGLHKQLYVKN